MLTLAQNTVLKQIQDATPPPLPEPSGLQHFVLEDPWLPAIGLALLGLGLAYVLRSRGRTRDGLLAALGGVLLAGSLVALATSVVTDREAIMEQSRLAAEAAFKGDAPAVNNLLAEDATLMVLGRQFPDRRQQMVERVQANPAQVYKINGYSINSVRATIDGPRTGRTQVSATVESSWGNVPTVWLLNWRQDTHGGPWRITRLEAQQIGFQRPGSITNF